jgi:hypothetical protein
MKRILWAILVAAACSGQMCGSTGTNPGGNNGNQNICGRQYFDSTFHVGFNPPPGAGQPRQGAANPAADLNRAWTWRATTPPTEFSLVVLEPVAEKTLAEFRQAWLDTFNQGSDFTVLNESFVTLSDGAQGWYLALSPNDQNGINSEFVMTVTQGRLVYVNAVYSADYVTDAQADQIGNSLISLCADYN